MRPVMPHSRNNARVKAVFPVPRSPCKWMRPPAGPPPAPLTNGANWRASASVAASSGRNRVRLRSGADMGGDEW